MDRDTALQQLNGGDPQSRRLAVRELGRWNDAETLGALVNALNDMSRDVQEAATDTLLEVGDSRAVRLLTPLLRSPAPSVRNFARMVLERLGKAEPSLIIDLARDPDPRMKIFCANILGGMSDHDFAPTLIGLLDDGDENVRDAAIVALGRLGAPESVPRLTRFLLAAEPWLRFSAIDALSKIGGPEAARALIDELPNVDAELREPMIDALGQQGSPESVDVLVRLLETLPQLRGAVLRALLGPLSMAVRSRKGDPGLRPLAKALAEVVELDRLESRLVPGALGMLGSMDVSEGAHAILRSLQSKEAAIASAAVRAASHLGLVAALPVLQGLLGTADPKLAQEIGAAIAVLEAPGKERL